MQFFIAIIFLLFSAQVFSAVLFEDRFDDHADWQGPEQMYNYQSDISSSNGTATTPCTNCPQDGPVYSGSYVAQSAWSDYKGNRTLNINSYNYRGTSGKALTFWMEPVNDTSCDNGSGWCSDGQLGVYLGQDINEMFIAYWIKFDPTWEWDVTNSTAKAKFTHAGHFNGEIGVDSQWNFGGDGNYMPYFIFDFSDRTQEGFDAFRGQMHPRFQASYQTGYHSCVVVPTPTYLVNSDYEAIYQTGGSGDSGYKIFTEWFTPGQWHHIEIRTKGNSGIGVADGEYQVWIDGVSIVSRSNVAWADEGDTCEEGFGTQPPVAFKGWNWVSIGGNQYNRKDASTLHDEQYYAIDDFVISTTRVGVDYVIGGRTPTNAPRHGASISGGIVK